MVKSLYISYDGLTEALVQSQVLPYIKGLTKRGITFTLLTFDKKHYLNEKKKIRLKLRNERIDWISLRYHKTPSFPATFYDVLCGVVVSMYLVRRKDITIIHARSYVAALIALVLKRILKLKFIFDMRGIWPDEKVDANTWPAGGFLYRLAKIFEKRFLLNADRIIVLTYKLKDIIKGFDYMRGCDVNIDVIPTCVDLDKFTINKKPWDLIKMLKVEDRMVFIYSGSIGSWYMLDEMIDFFKIVKSKINNAYFLFLTPFEKSYIENIMFSKGINKEDFSVKSIPYQEMPRWLLIGDIAVFFIKPLFSKKGSMPIKFSESLACGLPVIINSGIGDTENLVRLNRIGVIIDKFSTDTYVKASDEILELNRDREDLQTRCRKTAEDFLSLRQGEEKYWDIYQRLAT